MSTLVLEHNTSYLKKVNKACDTLYPNLVLLLAFFIPVSTTLAHVILILIVMSFLLTSGLQEKIKSLFANPAVKTSGILLLFFLLGSLYTTAPSKDIVKSLEKMSKLAYFIFLIPAFRDPRLRMKSILAFLAAMLLTLFLGFFKLYGDFSLLSNMTSSYSNTSVFKNRIDTNFMMSLAVFCVGQLLFVKKTRILQLTSIFLMVGMSFYCLCMSDGRSGYVTFAILWLVFCLQHLSLKKFLAALVLFCCFGGAMLAVPSQLQWRVQEIVREINNYYQGKITSDGLDFSTGKDSSTGLRLSFWKNSLALIQERPVFGFGTGAFKTAYQTQALKTLDRATTNPHNEYLNISVQLGLVGLFIFFIFLGSLFKASFRLPAFEKSLLQGLLIAFMVGSLINSWLMDFTPGYLFIVLASLCLATYPKRSGSDREARSSQTLSSHSTLAQEMIS